MISLFFSLEEAKQLSVDYRQVFTAALHCIHGESFRQEWEQQTYSCVLIVLKK